MLIMMSENEKKYKKNQVSILYFRTYAIGYFETKWFLHANYEIFLNEFCAAFPLHFVQHFDMGCILKLWNDEKWEENTYNCMSPKNVLIHIGHHMTSCTGLVELNYKLILSMKTIAPYHVTCVVWLKFCVWLKGKLGLFVGNSCMICML